MRRLRERDVVSQGIGERPRGAKGTVLGALHVYSGLNLDAARAARSDDWALARRLAKAAKRIERQGETVRIVRGLAGVTGSVSMRRRFESVASTDERLRTALQSVAAQTAAERGKLVESYPLMPPQLAVVMKLHGPIAELRLEGANEVVRLPLADLDALDSAFIGAGLALRWEPFGPRHTLITASPAIKLGDGSSPAIYPYERPLPDSGAPIALAGALVARPTMRRPKRIPIAGRR